jgi:KDO2-lipid IV(A) lauroyltransferase
VAHLPVTLINAIGSVVGMLIYRIVPSRRRIARINLKQAYPDLSDKEIDTLNKNAFKSLGISIFEMGVAWFKKSSTLKQQCQIEGKEHLDQAMAKNKGVILLTGHFTTLEIGSRLIGFYADKYNGVYKKAHNPLFNTIMVHYRSKFGDELIENKNVRGIIRGLKKGHATWFAPDQDFSDQDIVFTPFLGGIASTLTATAKMAKITGAAVVPFYPVRLENGKGYKLVVLPALENFPSDNIEDDSARVNKTIGDMIYNCPQQYLWSHKRFKTQPDRRSNFYAKKV